VESLGSNPETQRERRTTSIRWLVVLPQRNSLCPKLSSDGEKRRYAVRPVYWGPVMLKFGSSTINAYIEQL
ncbi:hypothetical protein A2U01_0104507, partial [Trifolium medium]|nr:hypothetical protein [Trifolium medium]